jgi:hypothetical protein
MRRLWTLLPLLVLCACAGYGTAGLKPGQTPQEVAALMGPPTGRHAAPDGAQRLEYARGPYGKHTYMIDLDADGRVQRWQQVLTEANFNAIVAGMPRAQVLSLLGRPSNRRPGGWQGGEIWSWRYDSPFCQWFQVTMPDDGKVRDTGYGADPVCEDLYNMP